MPQQPADDTISNLFREHAGTIYNLGLRMCPSTELAEDLVQETFLNAYRSWDKFEGRSKPSTWLWTIAVRACQRMTRKRAGEPARLASLDELLPSADGAIVDIPAADSTDVLDDIIRREAQEATEGAIGELPEPFRLALVLSDIAGLSLRDVAGILDVKEATVKTRVHRARVILRNAIASRFPEKKSPPPSPCRHVCLDLLHAKMEALDKGIPFALADEDLCERCHSMFAGLDLARDACTKISKSELPDAVSEVMRQRFGRGRNI